MAYTKTDWSTALITADNFNKLQEQYAEAVADAIGIRANGTAELRAEVVNDFPAHAVGRIIYHQGYKMFFYSNGIEWLLDPNQTFWGDAQNGIFSSTGDVTFANTSGATLIRNYRKFTLNPGDTITTQNPCRCLVIRSWDDITINGTFNLDKKGGLGDRYLTIGGVSYDLQGGDGGNGGKGGHSLGGAGGSLSENENTAGGRRGGGGGGGGADEAPAAGSGGGKNTSFNTASPTAFGGAVEQGTAGADAGDAGAKGSGGGGSARKTNNEGTVRGGTGGAPFFGRSSGGGGGGALGQQQAVDTFVNGGSGQIATEAGGGVLVLLSMKNIVINGQILLRGGKGGDGGDAAADTLGNTGFRVGGGGGGGGAGGGRLIAIRRGAYSAAGTIDLGGGTGGTGGNGYVDTGPIFDFIGTNGTAGATGTISTFLI